MTLPACTHPLAYVVAQNADLGASLSETPAFWECPRCGAKSETLDSFDAAADDLRAQSATKH